MRTEGGLLVEIGDRVANLVIDRPERLNALSQQLMRDLVVVFDDLQHDDDVWVVTLRGGGDRAFSGGVDLKEMHEGDRAAQRPRIPMTGLHRNAFEAVMEFPKPTIAIIRGYALGGGCELALACDLRIASEDATLGLPEATRGLAANFGAQMLSRVIPPAIAYQMLYTAKPLTAEQAERWGLVNQVVSAEELDTAASVMTRMLLDNAPLSLRRYKQAITHGRNLPLSAALRLDVSTNSYVSDDRLEGVAAFNEKRKPVWQAR